MGSSQALHKQLDFPWHWFWSPNGLVYGEWHSSENMNAEESVRLTDLLCTKRDIVANDYIEDWLDNFFDKTVIVAIGKKKP